MKQNGQGQVMTIIELRRAHDRAATIVRAIEANDGQPLYAKLADGFEKLWFLKDAESAESIAFMKLHHAKELRLVAA